ncbi:hypothetical protein [Spiroplasma attinicola]|nr:hypothetical protein [Spiroplasma sp. JKS002670]
MEYSKLLENESIINFQNNDLITMTFGEFIILQKMGKLDFNHPTQRDGV